MKKYWYRIHVRGLESTAVWQTHAPAFVFGEVTQASHAADVNLLNDHLQQCSTAENGWGAVRIARDTACAAIQDLCTRACRVVSGSLPAQDAMRDEVKDVRRVKGRSQQAFIDRGRKLVSLWQVVNTHRAQLTPVQPPLLVGTTDVGTFQSMLGTHAQVLQDVENKLAAFNKKKSQLLATVTRVDGNNKRWFEAWKGHFPSGSAERAALRQISKNPALAQPGQGVILESMSLPNLVVKLSYDAARATTFTLLHKGPTDAAYSVLADGLTVKTYDHTAAPVGAHTYKLIGRNSAGPGAESAPVVVQVAQQAAA